MPKPRKYVEQKNVLVSEQTLNAILRFVFHVAQSTRRYLFHLWMHKFVTSTSLILGVIIERRL